MQSVRMTAIATAQDFVFQDKRVCNSSGMNMRLGGIYISAKIVKNFCSPM